MLGAGQRLEAKTELGAETEPWAEAEPRTEAEPRVEADAETDSLHADLSEADVILALSLPSQK